MDAKIEIHGPLATVAAMSSEPIPESKAGTVSVCKVNFPADEEAMGDGITLVILPVKIPASSAESRKLFVRNEDVGLIKASSKPVTDPNGEELLRLRTVILGNPGISKSWHLWKYLVLAANRELWRVVSDEQDFPLQPQAIAFVRKTEDHFSVSVYYLEDKVVHNFKSMDALPALNSLSVNGSVRMLYEPAQSFDPVPHSMVDHFNIPCTASLSPLLVRYKEYLKQWVLLSPHIMPCPTWSEIEAIARFLYPNRNNVTTLERYKKVGPFLRILFAEEVVFNNYLKEVESGLRVMTLEDVNSTLRTIESGRTSGVSAPSHMYARYTTPKSSEGNFLEAVLVPASDLTHQFIQDRLGSLTEERLQEMLLHYEKGTDDGKCNPRALETLVKAYITSKDGLLWPWVHAKLTFQEEGTPSEKKCRSTKIHPFGARKVKVDYQASPKACMMEMDVLYKPSDPHFPFIDMLWVEQVASREDPYPPVSSIQCSISSSHPKNLSVYDRLRKRLGMPDEQMLIVYMATLPKCVEFYITGPVSTFFKQTKRKDNDTQIIPSNIQFRVLLSHQDMKNLAPDNTRYERALDEIYSLHT